jgi:quercetin dioxygenase-like cupin family protein
MKIEMNIRDVEYTGEKLQAVPIGATENFKAVQLILSEGQELKTHTTPVDAVLIVFEGAVEYTENTEVIKLNSGDVIQIKSKVPHSVKALQNSRLILVR